MVGLGHAWDGRPGIAILNNLVWMQGWRAVVRGTVERAKPTQFEIELSNDEAEHPDSFVVGMANFFTDGEQCGLFAG